MKLSAIFPTLRWFGYSVGFARVFGVKPAVLLGWSINRLPEDAPDAEFEASVATIMDATGLSEREVTSSREALAGVLLFRHHRLGHRSFWRIDWNELQDRVEKGSGNPTKRGFPNLQNVGSVPNPQNGGSPNLQNVGSGTHKTAVRGNRRELEEGEKKKHTPSARAKSRDRKPAPGRKGSTLLTPEAGEAEKAIIQAFAGVYADRFRVPYAPHPRNDRIAARSLMVAGITPAEVAAVFTEVTACRSYWCSKTNTLPLLANRWNDVRAEVAVKKPTAGGGTGTPEEWAAQVADETGSEKGNER